MNIIEAFKQASELVDGIEGLEVDGDGCITLRCDVGCDWVHISDTHAIDLICGALERWLIERGHFNYEYNGEQQGWFVGFGDDHYTNNDAFTTNGEGATKLEALLACAQAVKDAQ